MAAKYWTRVLEDRIEVMFVSDADRADHLQAIAEVASLLRERPGFGVLLDLTTQSGQLSWSDESAIAGQLKHNASEFAGGIAHVVLPGVQYGLSRIQQALAEPAVPFEVFTLREDAITWLNAMRGPSG